MGYFTRYYLETEPADDEIFELLFVSNPDAKYALSANDRSQWYDHEQQIREFSKEFPDTLFILEGEGDDSGDIWRKYFKNGKMQYCPAIISFDEYNEKELK